AHLARLEVITDWMDRRYLDPLLGFVFPGVGDTATSLLGLYGVYVGYRLETHPIVLARMLLNLGIDALLGSIPLAGAVFDIVYRAHERNLALLQATTERGRPRTSDWLLVYLALALLLFCAVVVPLTVLGVLA